MTLWSRFKRWLCTWLPHHKVDFKDGSGWWFCSRCFHTEKSKNAPLPKPKQAIPASWKEVN
jgi:hypothetical protein